MFVNLHSLKCIPGCYLHHASKRIISCLKWVFLKSKCFFLCGLQQPFVVDSTFQSACVQTQISNYFETDHLSNLIIVSLKKLNECCSCPCQLPAELVSSDISERLWAAAGLCSFTPEPGLLGKSTRPEPQMRIYFGVFLLP